MIWWFLKEVSEPLVRWIEAKFKKTIGWYIGLYFSSIRWIPYAMLQHEENTIALDDSMVGQEERWTKHVFNGST
jgi:hypothetical protein